MSRGVGYFYKRQFLLNKKKKKKMMSTSPSESSLVDSIHILFGSQTGNAEWMAKHIDSEASLRGFDSCCFCLNDYAKVDFTKSAFLLIITSTTGDGDPPENSTKFIRYIRRSKKEEFLKFKGKPYAILGLGDTNYSNFCATAKRIDKWLVEAGGVPIIPKGLADDAVGLESIVDPWIELLWKKLPEYVTLDKEKASAYEKSGTVKFSLSKIKANSEAVEVTEEIKTSVTVESLKSLSLEQNTVTEEKAHGDNSLFTPIKIPISTPSGEFKPSRVPADTVTVSITNSYRSISTSFSRTKLCESLDTSSILSNSKRIKIIGGGEITGVKAEKKVLELKVDLTELFPLIASESSPNTFIPGDAIGIYAPNHDALILPLITRLQLNPEQIIQIEQIKGSTDWPKEISVYELFKYFADIRG
ncbi:hypothetical protein HK096_010700, partial [Nowakowskiella sp. JEL0078]